MKWLCAAILATSCATVPDGATTDRSAGEWLEADGCPTIQLYNNTYTFDAGDIHNMRLAKEGCKRKYGVDSCLIRFYKMAPQTYRAVCKTFKVE